MSAKKEIAGSESRLEEFRKYREKMNERILGAGHIGINRFFNLDTTAYQDGALSGKTKELLGLVASIHTSWRITCSTSVLRTSGHGPHAASS